jgi:hypothetical protein
MVASPEDLVTRAQERTGFTDFGPDGWQIGLARLVEVVGREVLDPEAVTRIEAIIEERLVQRLRIEGWYSEHGESAAAPVESPIIVFGLPRTGTTALHHVLSLDPQLRYLRAWELADPIPPPVIGTEGSDPRRPTEAPRADVRHLVTIDGPAECWPIHALAFDHAELTLPVPSYSAWWRDRDHGELFGYHERFLRLLHSHRPPNRWLLKMPAYMFLLDEVAAQHPDATFVMTHRDPVAVVASTCSVVADSRRKRVPTWSPDGSFGPTLLEHWAIGAHRALEARRRLGSHRFVDVAQQQLRGDPAGTAQQVYEAAGLQRSDEVVAAMRSWADGQGNAERGAHLYSLQEFGLTEAAVTEAFAPYLQEFGELCRR